SVVFDVNVQWTAGVTTTPGRPWRWSTCVEFGGMGLTARAAQGRGLRVPVHRRPTAAQEDSQAIDNLGRNDLGTDRRDTLRIPARGTHWRTPHPHRIAV